MNSVPNNFLGLEAPHCDYDKARFVILPVPYDATTSYQVGTRDGPAAIISASQQVEWFDDELSAECHHHGIATLDPVEPNMAGPAQMHEDLYQAARSVIDDEKFLFALGGEHSISSALVRAAMTRHKKLSVLQIDAHCDLRDSYEGTPFSHASVMRRVVDLGCAIVPVGIRNVSREEHEFLQNSAIKPITARECRRSDDWIDQAVDRLGDVVYVTIDIDGLDPSIAPGTGTPEPGGLDWYQVTALLHRVATSRTIVGADLVEVMPIPGQAVTAFLAARLAHKLMSYICR